MYNAIDVAKYFVNLNKELTELQIQKLVYYSYVWYIVKFNDNKNNIVNKLFDERPRAWKYGPVFISIYEQMKFCDKSLVCKAYLKANDVNTKFDDKAEMILSLVYEFYGKYSGNRLSDMTRYEYPYKNTKLGDEIKDIDIYEWYRRTE